MSPASKSKSKDKKAGKEPPKGSSKPSSHVNTSGGISATRYNPLLGAFQTFETTPGPSASPFHVNGRFRNIDEMDDHIGNSFGTGTEYDSVSNNGSWSGESEDHKEKAPQPVPRQESVPGGENDKREKIRQKNEKKHQRQKERRAQELHERCSGYLMSRKLEALAHQLVAMGFSQERATMALILNEGRVEESVAWLFEGGDEDKHREHNLDGGGNLKIDISEELARISDMEIRYKASKQEIERAVVSSEGDLDMAEETLKTQKQEPPATPPKPEAMGDPPTAANGKIPMTLIQNAVRAQVRPTSSGIQQRDEKDFNYTKVAVGAGSSVDPGKSTQPLKKIPPNLEWAKPQQIVVPSDKIWATAGSNPSVSYSLASSLQSSPPPAKTETRYMAVGNELKSLQLGSVREPVIVMQRPQSVNLKQPPISNVSSSPPSTAMGRYPKSVETKPLNFSPFFKHFTRTHNLFFPKISRKEMSEEGILLSSNSCGSEAVSGPIRRVLLISAGATHSVALLSGYVVCSWGRGEDGQLGLGDAEDRFSPTQVSALDGQEIVSVTCGADHTTAYSESLLQVFSWGWGDFGRLGHGDSSDLFTPQSIKALHGLQIKQIACGDSHCLAVTMEGEVLSWGRNQNGQLGLGTKEDSLLPQRIESFQGIPVKMVAAGAEHTAAVTEDGELYGWGWGRYGNLGLGDRNDRLVPEKVSSVEGEKMVLVACGWRHTISVSSSGGLYTYGWSKYGQLGHGDFEDHLLPHKLESLSGSCVSQISGGWRHTMAVTTDGKLYGWGWNKFGQVGVGDNVDHCSPVQVKFPLDQKVVNISCGWRHTLAVTEGQNVFSWGRGTNGQLGHGESVDRNLPKIVEALSVDGTSGKNIEASKADVSSEKTWISPTERYAVVPNENAGGNGNDVNVPEKEVKRIKT